MCGRLRLDDDEAPGLSAWMLLEEVRMTRLACTRCTALMIDACEPLYYLLLAASPQFTLNRSDAVQWVKNLLV